MPQQFEITRIQPKGDKLSILHGRLDGEVAQLKCWHSAAYFHLIKQDAVLDVETEERTDGQYKDIFIKTCNGIPEKEQKKGFAGGGGGKPPRPIGAEGADLYFKALEASLKIASTADHPVKWATVANGTDAILEHLAKHAKQCNAIAEGK